MRSGAASTGLETALDLLRAGHAAEARTALTRLAEAGETQAMMVLADLNLRGSDLDPMTGLAWLERAHAAGVAAAARGVAAVLRTGLGGEGRDAEARDWFQRALDAGVAPAWRDLALLLTAQGATEGAEAALALAATHGDAWVRQVCVARGRDLATPARARAERAAADFTWPVAPSVPGEELRPGVSRVRDVLSPLTCDYLMTVARPWLSRSRTSDPASGRPVPDEARTSSGMNFALLFPDLVVDDAERRIAGAAARPLVHAEPLAVLRYEVGQEYRPHLDALAPGALAEHPFYRLGGQRLATAITYLNQPLAGGGTAFPRLDLRIEAEAGTTLVFRNTLADGSPDPDSLHAGLPVTTGEKWVCTLWFRAQGMRGQPGARSSEEVERHGS